MEISVHDLIKVNNYTDIFTENELPLWVKAALAKNPYVVVRRSLSPKQFLPIGIRGDKRSERYSAFFDRTKAIKVIRPEDIVKNKLWKERKEGIFQYLNSIENIMHRASVEWGIIGSVAFELVTQNQHVSESSDIDIIVRYQPSMTYENCFNIVKQLKEIPINVDIQVEYGKKAYSMHEYVENPENKILIKTEVGPELNYIDTCKMTF